MKKLLLFACAGLVAGSLSAQQYYQLPALNAGTNPGGLNNDQEEPLGAVSGLGWTSVLASTSTDAWSSNQNIPFSFSFNGNTETQFKVSNTGVLTFDVAAVSVPSSTNSALPSSSVPDKSICVWGLNISGANDAVIQKTFGTAPNRQHWITYASASATSIGTGYSYWSIVLEETSNSIYIVDQRTASSITGGNVALTAGIQINATTAISVAASPAVAHLGSGSADASDNSFYEFIYGTQPSYDLSLESYDIATAYGLNQTVSGDLKVRNKGSVAVTSYDFNYSVNGGAAVTSSVTNAAASGAFATSNESSFTATTAGTYDMKVWISNINGNPDANNSNDTLSYTFFAAQSTTRNVLAEEFSSSTCPPCKTWNDNVYNVALASYNQMGNKLVAKYQVPIPVAGDPSRNQDSDDRRAYYGVNAAPTMLVNGTEPNYDGIATWADASAAYAAAETAGLNTAAFVDIAATAEIDGQGATSTVTVNATVTPSIDMNSGDYRLQILVLQKAYTFSQATNNDFNYKHVVRKMLPDANGTTINLAGGASGTFNETYQFTVGNVTEGSFNLWNNDIEVIVFVENTSSLSIANASQAPVNKIGLNEAEVLRGISLFPNPASEFVNVEVSNNDITNFTLEMVNAVGQKVFTETYSDAQRLVSIPTTQFEAGVYVVTIKANNKIAKQQVVITK